MPNTIKSENWDSVTAPAIPSGWQANFAENFLTTDSSDSLSSPNSLCNSTNGSGHLIWDVADSSNGNVQVSAYFKSDLSPNSQTNMYLVARWGPQTTTVQSTATGYFAEIILNGGANTGCSIIAQNGSSSGFVAGPSFPSAFTGGIWYYMQLICLGSSIQMRIQRQDTSEWLNSSGTWVTDGTGQTFVFSITDTTVLGGGYAGVGFFGNGGGTVQRTDNFLFENLGGPLKAGSTYVSPASSTSLTVSGSRALGGAAPYNYQYQRSTDQSIWTNIGAQQTNLDPTTDPSPFTDTGLTPGTIYYYRTEQVDSAGPPATLHTPVTSMAPRAAAATYYISSTGSDSNNGTSSGTPWQTVSHASAWGAMPGDTFLFHGGDTFSGSLTFMNVAGTYVSPLTIDSYGTGRATISCGDSWGVRLAKCSGCILRNLIIVGSGVNSDGSTTNRYTAVDVVNPNLSGTLSHIWIDNLDCSGCYSGIEVWGVGITYQNTGSGFQDVRITNCVSHDTAYCGIFVRILPLVDQNGNQFMWYAYDRPSTLGSTANNYNIFKGTQNKYIYVGNNVVYNSFGDPLRTDPVHSGDGIMVKSAQYTLTERCLVRDSGQNGFGPAGNWIQEVTNGVIRYCETHHFHTRGFGTDGDGFDMDGGCVDCVTEYCYSHDCDGAGYLCGPYQGGNSPVRCVLRYCISERDGIGGLGAIFPYGGADITIHNCVVYSPPSLHGNTECVVADGGVKAYNNIFLTSGGVNFINGGPSAVFIGNCYHNLDGQWELFWNGTSYTDLATWVTASGQETLNGQTVGLSVDPLLKAPNTGTAQLPNNQVSNLTAYDQTSSSPTINAGIDLYLVGVTDPGPIDIHGFPNRAGTTTTTSGYDMGAQKFGASSLIPSGSGGSGGGCSRARLNAGV